MLTSQILVVALTARLSRYRPFAEFVEVVLLPLDEFQTKIDGESPSRCHVRPQDNHADTFPFVFS